MVSPVESRLTQHPSALPVWLGRLLTVVKRTNGAAKKAETKAIISHYITPGPDNIVAMKLHELA